MGAACDDSSAASVVSTDEEGAAAARRGGGALSAAASVDASSVVSTDEEGAPVLAAVGGAAVRVTVRVTRYPTRIHGEFSSWDVALKPTFRACKAAYFRNKHSRFAIGATWHFVFAPGGVRITAELFVQNSAAEQPQAIGYKTLSTADLAAVLADPELSFTQRVKLSVDRAGLERKIADVETGSWRGLSSVAVVRGAAVFVWRAAWGAFESSADGSVAALDAVCPRGCRVTTQTVYDYEGRGVFDVVRPRGLVAAVEDAATRRLVGDIFARADSAVIAGRHRDAQ